MENKLKTYDKVQYTGNENHWGEPTKVLSKHAMDEGKADELNQYFGSTGIKYIEGEGQPYDGEAPASADHGEPGLIVVDGELKTTDDKAADIADKQNRDVTDTVKSNGEIKDTEEEPDKHSSVQVDPKVGTEEVEPKKED